MGLHEGLWGLTMRNWKASGERGHSEVLERSVDCMVCQVGCPHMPQTVFVLGISWGHGGWGQITPVLWPL